MDDESGESMEPLTGSMSTESANNFTEFTEATNVTKHSFRALLP